MTKSASRSARIRNTLALIATLALLLAGCGSSKPSAAPSTSPSASATASPSSAATTSPPAPSVSAAPPLGSPVNQPLWPFSTLAQAQAWEQSYVSGGHQPWHVDAGATALAFTQGYLGFAGIDKVTSSTVSGRDAHVGVGFATPSSPPGTSTSAVIHLVRYGQDTNAPWEVVGTDDTTFALTMPAYGARATSPLVAGGTISGVDENIRVKVLQPSSNAPLGQSAPKPAGGTNTPWSTQVMFTGATDPVLTVVAYTGGHLMAVERFAVTAIRAG